MGGFKTDELVKFLPFHSGYGVSPLQLRTGGTFSISNSKVADRQPPVILFRFLSAPHQETSPGTPLPPLGNLFASSGQLPPPPPHLVFLLFFLPNPDSNSAMITDLIPSFPDFRFMVPFSFRTAPFIRIRQNVPKGDTVLRVFYLPHVLELPCKPHLFPLRPPNPHISSFLVFPRRRGSSPFPSI